jgi:carbon storage regulator
MLVIGRRPGEILMIGDEIEIEILESSHSSVKLGIRAPKQITILRKEIHVTEEQNRIAARQVSATELEKLLGRLC